VAIVIGAGLTIGLLTRPDGTTSAGGSLSTAVDWTAPQELPPPKFEDIRSEFVSDEEGLRFLPRSGRVTPNVAHRFDTGHCGLTFLADFDGSFWRPIPPDASAPTGFFVDQDVGAIALVGQDLAIYRSSTGIDVELARIRGSVTTFPCE
jgi:hypothetical protein